MMTMRNDRERCRAGFSLVEVMVVLTIMATVAVLVLPEGSGEDRLRVMGAADIIASDIELAQVMTISYPDEPVIVKFDVGSS